MKNLLAACLLAGVMCSSIAANPVVEMETSAGTMSIELYPDKAPETVKTSSPTRAAVYADRISPRDRRLHDPGRRFDARMKEKPARAPIKNEAKNGLHNQVGTIAMARTRDPHSAAAQFSSTWWTTVLDYPSFDGWGCCRIRQGHPGAGRSAQDRQGQDDHGGLLPGRAGGPVIIKSVRVIDSAKAGN